VFPFFGISVPERASSVCIKIGRNIEPTHKAHTVFEMLALDYEGDDGETLRNLESNL